MITRARVPGPPLSEFVQLLWLYDGYYVPHEKERVLPDGSTELVIDLRRGHGVVVGARSQFMVIDTSAEESVIGVHFKAGGAFPFLGLPADELRDQVVSLETLWGCRRAAEVRDRLLQAPTPEVRLAVLEQSLLEVARHLGRHPAVAHALRQFQQVPHVLSVADVTEEIGLSSRRFIQVFSQEVGLTPKVFCRVQRFQEVLRRIKPGVQDWADVALSCGYYDQAHFNRDFHAISGVTPTAYLQRQSEHQNHVPM